MYYFIDEITTANQNRTIHAACGNGDSVVQTRYQDVSHGNLRCTPTKINVCFSLTRNSTSITSPWALVEDAVDKCADQRQMFSKTIVETLARKRHDAGKHRTVQTEMSSPGRSQPRTKLGCIRRPRRNTFLCISRARNLIKPAHETLSLFFPPPETISPPCLTALSSYEDEANMTGEEAESERVKVILVGLVETAGHGTGDKSQSLEVLELNKTNLENAKIAVMFLSQVQPNGKGNESPS